MKEFKNILAYSLANLGDVVLTTSAVALLRKAYPAAKITMMVRPVVREAVENNPLFDDVILFDYKSRQNSFGKMWEFAQSLRQRRFDMCISFDRKLRPAIITYLAGIPVRVGPSRVFDDKPSRVTWLYTDTVQLTHNLNKTLQAETYQAIVRGFCGIKGAAEPVMADIMPVNKLKAEALLRRLPSARLRIALCVKGTFPLKTWPKEYFAQTVEQLNSQYDAAFFIVGAPNDKEYADEVIREINNVQVANFCEETGLTDLAALLSKTDLLVTVDTGGTHIAATTGIPMVTMYGCTSPDRWHPINKNARVLTSNEPCCPCTKRAAECERPACLWNVTPEMVLKKCDELLEGKQ